MAKSFCDEETSVKLQALNLATSASESSSSDSSESEEDGEKNGDVKKAVENNVESEDSESSSSSSNAGSESESGNSATKVNHKAEETSKPSAAKTNLDLLLDLDDVAPVAGQLMTPSLGGLLTPMMPSAGAVSNRIELVGPSFIAMDSMELLNKVNGYGPGITYKYTRSPHLFSSKMVSVELTFKNHGNVELTDI